MKTETDKTNKPETKKNNNSNNSYYGFLWAILIILFLNGMIFPLFNQKRIVGTDYGSFIAKVEQGQVTRVTIKNGQIYFVAIDSTQKPTTYQTG